MSRTAFILGFALLVLAACQPAGDLASLPPTEVLLGWRRDPAAILFRADRVALADAPGSPRYEAALPDCTIYGDNRIVWVNVLGAFEDQVLTDRLTDEQIFTFIDTLTVSGRLYTYQIPTDDPELPTPAPDVNINRETLTMAISGISFTTDERSGWNPTYYERVVEICRGLASAPVLYEPLEGAWLSTTRIEASDNGVNWPGTGGVSLAAAVQSPVWVSGEAARAIWNTQRQLPDPLFIEGDAAYAVDLRVPGITRGSPPRP